jgi:hypothetical protein
MRLGVRIVINFKRKLRNVGKNETCDTPAHHTRTHTHTHTHTYTQETHKNIIIIIIGSTVLGGPWPS